MTNLESEHAEVLDAFRRQNLGWMLFRLARDFQVRFTDLLSDHDSDGRLAHAMVLGHLPLEGCRLTELAAAAGVTKQSMGALVDDMEHFGYVHRIPDPDDGRAKRICFTEAGIGLLEDSREAVDHTWALYSEILGERRLTILRNSLAALVNGIERAGEASPASTPR
ncbi:MAG: MarR family transcriptional regulator [Deltaproteobacteria bacterium]|nr:MarR family transcriptional regulator [Deltaproteobacteria bacterium]